MTSEDDIRLLLLNRKREEALSLLKEEEKLEETLMKIAKDDPKWEIRREAVKLLGKGEVTEAHTLLKDILLTDHLTIMRKTAAQALGDLNDPVAIPALIEGLKINNDPAIIGEIAISLGKLEAKEAVEPLIAALENNDGEVREHAVDALGLIGDPCAIKPLIKRLKEDPEDWVRGQAADALGLIGDPQALEPLIETLRNDVGIGVSMKTAKALGRLKDPAAVDPLIDFLNQGQNDETRRAITFALGEIGDKKAADVFLELLENDTDPTVRYWSCLSLGFMKYKKATNVLLDTLLEDSSPRVRKTAAISLGQINPKTKKAVKAILQAKTKDEDEEVQATAENILKKLAKNQGFKSITEFLTDLRIEVPKENNDS
ncbi:MAG: hypothetical protein GF308_13025 [Candidatus Heimdallarchaeota archaeon]|nr:hypothetical protein [Candidatus Heimdallarchaeota archaeon]